MISQEQIRGAVEEVGNMRHLINQGADRLITDRRKALDTLLTLANSVISGELFASKEQIIDMLNNVRMDSPKWMETVADALLSRIPKSVEPKEDLIYQYKGGEDDGYGGKIHPITWKEAYEEHCSYESWAMKEMKKACEKIKAHPEWKYGENAYPSSYERAIVAGCGQAVEELQAEIAKLKLPKSVMGETELYTIVNGCVNDMKKIASCGTDGSRNEIYQNFYMSSAALVISLVEALSRPVTKGDK